MSAEVTSLKSEVLVLRSICEGAIARIGQLEERVRKLETEKEEGWTRVSSAGSEASAGTEVDKEDHPGRRQLAIGIGRFLRRSLNGEHRGSSGRDRLKLANRCYLVAADFRGNRLARPICTESFQEVKNLCKVGPDTGDSIFVGFASKWEAKVACEEAGLILPDSLKNV